MVRLVNLGGYLVQALRPTEDLPTYLQFPNYLHTSSTYSTSGRTPQLHYGTDATHVQLPLHRLRTTEPAPTTDGRQPHRYRLPPAEALPEYKGDETNVPNNQLHGRAFWGGGRACYHHLPAPAGYHTVPALGSSPLNLPDGLDQVKAGRQFPQAGTRFSGEELQTGGQTGREGEAGQPGQAWWVPDHLPA